ncbi:MAG TPA: sulfite exporter TauE/SafE family protein [Chitinophagaceae bacterium]|nr:sulfite exporter TauE/SafE family protein [Chitinophagaceae bacterium]
MHIAGYIAAALIGISLGLIGGGGSILTVPVLVYLFGINPTLATSYSLFVVGTTSLAGAVNNYRKGWLNIKTALLFGISSVITVFATRKFIIPHIPNHLAYIGGINITSGIATMVLFAVLMLFASISMIRSNRKISKDSQPENKAGFIKLLGYGIGIGIVTGLLGAGGGFLLIPALVLVLHLPMKQAVGTSLLIIAMNSLTGFAGDLGYFTIDWRFLLEVTLIAVAGIFVGGMVAKKINGASLKRAFGWFVLVMGIYIILKEIFMQ